ncbi:MAG: tetratricopeptide repeat protein [Alphaproteobacteria bacterium]|nr:tetratricopeptide repeat protein [Alphaproteobacteria bacterium]
MRALIAIALTACLGACIPPLNADTVDLAWERCNGPGASDYRLSQCSTVISFADTTPERRAAALIVRGTLRAEESQYERALADFGRALRLDRDNPQIYLQRAFVHQASGAFDFAVRDFDRALALQPGLQAALDGREAALQLRVTSFQQELTILNQRLVASPRDADLLNSRCWLRVINNDDLDAALADCNASLAARPNDANVLDSRGLAQFKRGDYAAALADYDTAVRLEPQSGHFLYGRGLARVALGMTAEGQADQAHAEELQPGIARQYQDYNILPPKPAAEEPLSAE